MLDFRNKLPDKEVDSTYFADLVRSAALRTVPTLQVITRENLIVLLQSTGRKIEDCEGECEVDTGRRIGADLVISGDLLKVGTFYKLNLRLHETHGGQLVSGTVVSGKTVDDLDANTTAAVGELLQPLRAAAAQPPLTRRMPETHNSPPPAPDEPRRPNEKLRTAGWYLMGASVLFGGGAGYFALHGKSLANDVKSGNASTGAELAQKAADSKDTNTRTLGLALTGGIALVSGAVLVFLNRPAPALAVGTSGNALLVAGRF